MPNVQWKVWPSYRTLWWGSISHSEQHVLITWPCNSLDEKVHHRTPEEKSFTHSLDAGYKLGVILPLIPLLVLTRTLEICQQCQHCLQPLWNFCCHNVFTSYSTALSFTWYEANAQVCNSGDVREEIDDGVLEREAEGEHGDHSVWYGFCLLDNFLMTNLSKILSDSLNSRLIEWYH